MTTYTNRELSHAWAYANTYEKGKTQNDNFSFEGYKLYSYSTMIMLRLEGGYCLENKGNYSVTTSNHQHLARMACRDERIVAGWENERRGFYFSIEQIITSYEEKLTLCFENLAKAKRQSTKDKATSELAFAQKNLSKLLEIEYLKKKDLTKKLKDFLKMDFSEGLEEIKQKLENQRKKELERKAKFYKKELKDWRNQEKQNLSYEARQYFNQDFVRIIKKGNDLFVKTSQSLEIAINEALRLYKITKKAFDSKQKVDVSKLEKRNIGYYTIDSIDNKGNAKIGCHFLKFEEIKRCYDNEYLKLNIN